MCCLSVLLALPRNGQSRSRHSGFVTSRVTHLDQLFAEQQIHAASQRPKGKKPTLPERMAGAEGVLSPSLTSRAAVSLPQLHLGLPEQRTEEKKHRDPGKDTMRRMKGE